jgi:argininosuccinate lyase
VFATDRALELVAKGMPFRDAYRHVKEHLEELREADPAAAVARKTHLGAPAGLDWARVREEVRACRRFARREWAKYRLAVSRLMGVNYPLSGREGAVE